MHKDHYENIYAVIRGRKEFTLLPPLALPGLYERVYVCARYTWGRLPHPRSLSPAGAVDCAADSPELSEGWGIAIEYDSHDAGAHGVSQAEASPDVGSDVPCPPARRIPWVSVNPAAPDLVAFPAYASVARFARKAVLGPGDVLYLPALWYHQASVWAGVGTGERRPVFRAASLLRRLDKGRRKRGAMPTMPVGDGKKSPSQ